MHKNEALRIINLKLKTIGNENSGYIVNWYKEIPTRHKLHPDIFMHYDSYEDPEDPPDLIDEDGNIFIAGSYLDPGNSSFTIINMKVN
jgi:hypothetical protein